MKAILREHEAALRTAWAQLRARPGSFLLNMIVVAIALALPFAGLTLLDNLRPVSSRMVVQPEISVFMALTTPRERVLAVESELRAVARKIDADAKITFVAREDALAALKDRSGLSDTLSTLDANPLPDAYVITLTGFDSAASASKAEQAASDLARISGVEAVQVDSAWVKKLAALLRILRLVLLALAVTLGLVVVAVVFNTVRLQVMTQRDEIRIARLVGANDAFIHRPFQYIGALLGLSAGILALTGVGLLLGPINTAVVDFARLYASEFRLAPLGVPLMLGLLGISAGLGLLGAMLSVRRHLATAA